MDGALLMEVKCLWLKNFRWKLNVNERSTIHRNEILMSEAKRLVLNINE